MARKIERIDAKKLYIEELREMAEISKRITVPVKTLYRWKSEDLEKGDDWDKEREKIHTTSNFSVNKFSRVLLDRLAKMLDEIAAGAKIDPSAVYAMRQLILSVNSFKKKEDKLGDVLLMVKELVDFITERYPEERERLHPILTEFGEEMGKKFGRK